MELCVDVIKRQGRGSTIQAPLNGHYLEFIELD
ncbi:hypothetical protein [Escherichia coli]